MRWRVRNLCSWHYWFAWHPIKIDNEWVWLEQVLRRKGLNYGGISEYTYKDPLLHVIGDGNE